MILSWEALIQSMFLKGHDFSRVAIAADASSFTGCGKTDFERQEASGHDFSRAVNATKERWALAPEGHFFQTARASGCRWFNRYRHRARMLLV
jgi:hypothetical protein